MRYWYLWLLCFIVLVMVVWPIMQLGYENSIVTDAYRCAGKLKTVGESILLYTADYDEHLPVADNWSQTLSLWSSDHSSPMPELRLPCRGGTGGIGMNGALGATRLGDIANLDQTIFVMEHDRLVIHPASDSFTDHHHGFVPSCTVDLRSLATSRRVAREWLTRDVTSKRLEAASP